MKIKCSIVMSSFSRSGLLNHGLFSLNSQIQKLSNDYDFEIVVNNDGFDNDETRAVCERFKVLNVKYVFSGQRNSNGAIFRNPAVPNNIAFKQSSGDIVFLTCPEIYHYENSLEKSLNMLKSNKKIMTTFLYLYMDDGRVLNNISNNIEENHKYILNCGLDKHYDLIEMPFFMGLWRDEFEAIGGYDEDFIGYAGEDNDLVRRLIMNGLKYSKFKSDAVHLFHGKAGGSLNESTIPKGMMDKWRYNIKIAEERKNILVRNKGKEWGK